MKKTANMQHVSSAGRVSHLMIGFSRPSVERAVSGRFCVNMAKQTYAPAQIVMNESRLLKFLRNITPTQ